MTKRPSIRGYLVLLVGLASPAQANPGQGALCLQAAEQAGAETGVPLSVLMAVALTETGRASGQGDPQPWPWVSNQGGEAHWFASKSEAVAYVDSQLEQGVTNIDLGCFQLNHRWHAAAFGSTKDMFDPIANARYAARLLAGHFERMGDWSLAAGAYHSGTPEFAERYRTKFDAHLARLVGEPVVAPLEQPVLADLHIAPRENRFPLLLAGNRTSGASLFPILDPGRRLIGD